MCMRMRCQSRLEREERGASKRTGKDFRTTFFHSWNIVQGFSNSQLGGVPDRKRRLEGVKISSK